MDALPGDAESKRKLRVILRTLSGELSVDEACRQLGIGPAYFAELRTRALAGALVALKPRAAGRPRRARLRSAEEADELERELQDLRREVQILQAQVDLVTTLGGLLPGEGGGPERHKSGGRRGGATRSSPPRR